MGGLDWSGLEVVCDVLGVDDPETFITQLTTLRDNPELLKDG